MVTGAVIERLTEPIKVYNLEVADFNTYFVGDEAVLVHNYNELDDDTPVVRGETCKAEQFENGSGVTIDDNGLLNGVSVNIAPPTKLSQPMLNIKKKYLRQKNLKCESIPAFYFLDIFPF